MLPATPACNKSTNFGRKEIERTEKTGMVNGKNIRDVSKRNGTLWLEPPQRQRGGSRYSYDNAQDDVLPSVGHSNHQSGCSCVKS